MAKSHPTYDMWGKYAGTFEDRMKKVKAVDPYSKEGQKLQEESRKKYGAWWLFTDKGVKNAITRKTWIMQYYKSDQKKRDD